MARPMDLRTWADRRWRLAAMLAALLLAAAFGQAPVALAGGGPENVLLVVNPNSQNSLAIANHYAQLRRIPGNNLLFLPWNPGVTRTDIKAFRQQILLPILRTIQKRGLADQIDAVVYSSDFPWGIALDDDFRRFAEAVQKKADGPGASAENPAKPGGESGKPKAPPAPPTLPPPFTPVGSINGLTYLWQPVLMGSPDYISPRSNWYMRQPITEQRDAVAAGFRASRCYDQRGQVVATGRRYLLSMMLGVTSGRGNTLDEVLYYLERSAMADDTQPTGTIYFVQNDDIRSKVRDRLFPTAVRDLKRLGVAAAIIQGTVPLNRRDVQGVVMGTSDFNWRASGSTILPGAICEHFTSYGGFMAEGYGQTPLSEFLRYGAAGASGTVVEPYAIAEKFPSPMIQVYYANGCTLIEAFYQSVQSPYQLLVVGDPLCRPWAKIPSVAVEGVKADAAVRGVLALKPSARCAGNAAADHFELFVDGFRQASCKPGETLSLDTTRFADGWHELRVVAIGPKPIETQGRAVLPVRFDNHRRTLAAWLAGDPSPRLGKKIAVAFKASEPMRVVVLRGELKLGETKGATGRIEFPADKLGAGSVRIEVLGTTGDKPSDAVMAAPLELAVAKKSDSQGPPRP